MPLCLFLFSELQPRTSLLFCCWKSSKQTNKQPFVFFYVMNLGVLVHRLTSAMAYQQVDAQPCAGIGDTDRTGTDACAAVKVCEGIGPKFSPTACTEAGARAGAKARAWAGARVGGQGLARKGLRSGWRSGLRGGWRTDWRRGCAKG